MSSVVFANPEGIGYVLIIGSMVVIGFRYWFKHRNQTKDK